MRRQWTVIRGWEGNAATMLPQEVDGCRFWRLKSAQRRADALSSVAPPGAWYRACSRDAVEAIAGQLP